MGQGDGLMPGHNVQLSVLPVDTDEDRGKFLLTAHSEVINHGAIKVEEAFRDLLETGAWRSYTFPDGTHHEWLDREFDYFVSSWLASQDDQRWELVKRSLVSRDVIMAIADHTGGHLDGDGRRSLEEVRSQFPGVTVEAIKMVSDRERTIALDEAKRREYLVDETSTAHGIAKPNVKRWQVHYSDGDLAAAIVAKLKQDPKLAKIVYNELRSGTRPDTKKWR